MLGNPGAFISSQEANLFARKFSEAGLMSRLLSLWSFRGHVTSTRLLGGIQYFGAAVIARISTTVTDTLAFFLFDLLFIMMLTIGAGRPKVGIAFDEGAHNGFILADAVFDDIRRAGKSDILKTWASTFDDQNCFHFGAIAYAFTNGNAQINDISPNFFERYFGVHVDRQVDRRPGNATNLAHMHHSRLLSAMGDYAGGMGVDSLLSLTLSMASRFPIRRAWLWFKQPFTGSRLTSFLEDGQLSLPAPENLLSPDYAKFYYPMEWDYANGIRSQSSKKVPESRLKLRISKSPVPVRSGPKSKQTNSRRQVEPQNTEQPELQTPAFSPIPEIVADVVPDVSSNVMPRGDLLLVTDDEIVPEVRVPIGGARRDIEKRERSISIARARNRNLGRVGQLRRDIRIVQARYLLPGVVLQPIEGDNEIVDDSDPFADPAVVEIYLERVKRDTMAEARRRNIDMDLFIPFLDAQFEDFRRHMSSYRTSGMSSFPRELYSMEQVFAIYTDHVAPRVPELPVRGGDVFEEGPDIIMEQEPQAQAEPRQEEVNPMVIEREDAAFLRPGRVHDFRQRIDYSTGRGGVPPDTRQNLRVNYYYDRAQDNFGNPNFSNIADNFFGVLRNQLQETRPYPFYNLDAEASLEQLDRYAAVLDNKLAAHNDVIPMAGPEPYECSGLEYLGWVDTYMTLFPEFIARIRGPHPENAVAGIVEKARRWNRIYNVYRNLTVPPSDTLQRVIGATQTSHSLAEYLRSLWNGYPSTLTSSEKHDNLNAALLIIANNPRYLAYLRNKTVSKISGIWSLANANVQQAQLEDVYVKMKDMSDFLNEPKVVEMKRILSELYSIKKRISTGKGVKEDSYTMPDPRPAERILYKGASYPVSGKFVVDASRLHSLFVTFPTFRALGRVAGETPAVIFRAVGVPEQRIQEVENLTQDLYKISRINEQTGVSLRPKAYIYWVNQLAKILFFDIEKPAVPKMQTPFKLTSFRIEVIFTGFAAGTQVMLRSYTLQDAAFAEYPFLGNSSLAHRFVFLLDKISKQNYKLEQYKAKVANRQRYALTNQNTKMVNTVYGRFGINRGGNQRMDN